MLSYRRLLLQLKVKERNNYICRFCSTNANANVHNQSKSLDTDVTLPYEDSKPEWRNLSYQRLFIDSIASKRNITDPNQWYDITATDLINSGGLGLIRLYKHSIHSLLSAVYPEHNWLPWKFRKGNAGYWDDIQRQKTFLDWAATQLNVKNVSDWLKIKKKDLQSVGGTSLLHKYNDSPYLLLSTVYKEHEWFPWQFERCSQGFWQKRENHVKFLEWAKKELKIKEMSDWYSVTAQDIRDIGGAGLLEQYEYSPSLMLSKVYPDYPWDMFRFDRISDTWENLFQDKQKRKEFVEYLTKELNIQDENDWKSISMEKLRSLKVPKMKLVEIMSIVKEFVPSINLNDFRNIHYKKSQGVVKSMLQSLFPGEEILEEYKHPDLVTSSGHLLELDFYFPYKNLAVEYQGKQHYSASRFQSKSSVESAKQLDFAKKEMTKRKGITLLEIPFWWDKKIDSLAATLYIHRPDLFKEQPPGKPIPSTEPHWKRKYIESKEAETKKKIMTATVWDDSMDPTGWWMSEKFDGIRVFWDGNKLFTRQGREIKTPAFISDRLPTEFALDGELWTQYGLHQEAAILCHTMNEEKWKNAIFWIFDAPDLVSSPFEKRVEQLHKMKNEGLFPEFVKPIDFVECKGNEHLKEYFQAIVKRKGEGVMLREPNSRYEPGRSKSLRKYKEFFDTEVKVLKNNYPHGLDCLQLDGKKVFVGVSENQEEAQKVKEGSVVTVKYLGTNTYGTLLYPKFYRVRTDVLWNDLV